MERILIIVTVPPENAEQVLNAIAEAGGGVIGEYTHCAYVSPGTGRFKPSEAANPAFGARAHINEVAEIRIETFCDRSRAREVVTAIRRAHPYEEPVIYLLPLLDETAL